MLRRQFNQSALGGLVLGSPLLALAQGKPPADGADYISLDQPAPTEGGPGKVDVVEFFLVQLPALQCLRAAARSVAGQTAQKCPFPPGSGDVPAQFRTTAAAVLRA